MHIDLFRTVLLSLILLLSNVAWADRNNEIKVINDQLPVDIIAIPIDNI